MVQFIIILSVCIILTYYLNNKNKQKYIDKRKEEIEKGIHAELFSLENELEDQRKLHENYIRTLQDVKDKCEFYAGVERAYCGIEEEKKKELAAYEAFRREEIKRNLEELEAAQMQTVMAHKEIALEKARQEIDTVMDEYRAVSEKEKEEAQKYIEELKAQLMEYEAKQDAINQEIIRRRQLEEQTDFYRVCLPPEVESDIALLQATRKNLKKPEILDKLLYDNYIAKPVLEMIKRVLANRAVSGIYKITCLETKEIYIGKSTDVKARWQQHCKSAFNCGTIATSLLHRKMQQYGIENFSFELLEEVPKDKLSEREKFYINFYKTKEVGLNERNG